ncbi:MAG: 3-oxoacyl-ACP reductase family protein [Acidobacteriota bacterium]
MNRTALVTGASRGIGRAIALRLARDGAAIGVNYANARESAEKVCEEIAAAGGRAVPLHADIAQREQVLAMLAELTAKFGAPDILVNNAGLLVRGDLADFDYSQMERMRGVNVDGLVHVTRACVDAMKERGWGRIVNLSSLAALGTTNAGTTFYAATKAAVIALTKRFALELGPSGITVNVIAPGFIGTDMVLGLGTPEKVEEITRNMAKLAMVGRIGTPEDIAHATAFLCAEESSFITAQTLTVDGGRMNYIGHG